MESGRENVRPRTLRQTFRRATFLPRRYGISSRKFAANLEAMVSSLRRHNAVGTFPVTASVVRRHPEVVKILDGMEVAVHGLNHKDMSKMQVSQQVLAMKTATEVLRSLGIEATGFRAPYLRWSDSMLDAAEETGFLYDSSVAVAWSCGSRLDDSVNLKVALASYGTKMSGQHTPSLVGRLVEMPVAIPDDEILIDRLSIEAANELEEVFLGMMNSALATGGHLVLQLHPERFRLFQSALEAVLRLAHQQDVWIAPLREIAAWWRDKPIEGPRWPRHSPCTLTVSGDIDAATLGDYVLRRLGR